MEGRLRTIATPRSEYLDSSVDPRFSTVSRGRPGIDACTCVALYTMRRRSFRRWQIRRRLRCQRDCATLHFLLASLRTSTPANTNAASTSRRTSLCRNVNAVGEVFVLFGFQLTIPFCRDRGNTATIGAGAARTRECEAGRGRYLAAEGCRLSTGIQGSDVSTAGTVHGASNDRRRIRLRTSAVCFQGGPSKGDDDDATGTVSQSM